MANTILLTFLSNSKHFRTVKNAAFVRTRCHTYHILYPVMSCANGSDIVLRTDIILTNPSTVLKGLNHVIMGTKPLYRHTQKTCAQWLTS